jgi:hypothetical protein
MSASRPIGIPEFIRPAMVSPAVVSPATSVSQIGLAVPRVRTFVNRVIIMITILLRNILGEGELEIEGVVVSPCRPSTPGHPPERPFKTKSKISILY